MIREAQLEDAEQLIQLKRGYIQDTTTLPLTSADYPTDIGKEEQLIASYKYSPNSVLLLAEHDQTLIGNIDLTGSARSKMAHTAMLGMGIAQGWRNRGIGTKLMANAIRWATDQSQLELLWLDVYSTNGSGIALYKKMGFVVSGVIEHFFKQGNQYVDKLQMYLPIKRQL